MYSGNSKLVNVTLNHCREGSVIVNFTITFRVLDSNELLIFTDATEKNGRIADLEVSSATLSVTGVPNQTPEITKIYLTSATSVKVSWMPVTDGPINGYQVAFRPLNDETWNTVAVNRHTTNLHQTDLQEGIVYRIRVMAFNENGNGLPGEGEEIKMEEGVPEAAPLVTVEDMTSPHSFAVSWTPLPEEYVMGRLLGYRVIFKAVKAADERVDNKEATLTVDGPEVLLVELTGLKSYTSYVVQVAGFTSKGDGPLSAEVTGETCRCPGVFYTNWAVLPPYVTKSIRSQSPQGIIGTFVEEMLSESCGVCKSHGHTSLNFKTNGKGDTAYKTTMNEVILDVNSKTAISFPVTGTMDNDKFQRYYVFVPMVESPGMAFITVRQKDGSKNRVISTLLKYLPLYLFCLMTAYVAGTIIWALETSRDDGFAHSFIKGAVEGFWFSFISMTTVGYGDRVPTGVWSRLFTVAWILTGLVMASVLIGVLATSLTFHTIEKDIMLYGTKVTALADSAAHRLGVRRNALIRPQDTLQEAYKSLEQGEVKGLLLDAYVAGSRSIKHLFDQQLRVKEVIKLPKGFGIVLSGEAMKLQKRIRDYIRNNAGLISKMIENSTSPLQQPEKSEAEEQATELFSVDSSLFHEILLVLLQALGAAVFCGLVWEAIRKLLAQTKTVFPEGHGCARLMTHRNEMLKTVQNFHDSFRKLYMDLSYISAQELQHFEQERKRREKDFYVDSTFYIHISHRVFNDSTDTRPFPIGLYPLDATHGVNDTSSCRNLPGVANGTTLAPGHLEEPNTAYRFRKSQSSFIRISNSGIYNTNSITLLNWFKTEATMGHQTILQLSSEGKLAFLMATDGGMIYLEVYPKCNVQPRSIFPDITIEASTWYFIGVSYDHATGLMAIRTRTLDGRQVDGSISVGVIKLDTGHDIWLGYGPKSPGAFTGSMACFQVYDEPLIEEDITEAMRMCLPTQWSEPFAIYALNDSNQLIDSSGNSNPDGIARNIDETEGPYGEGRSIAFEGNSESYIQISQDGEFSLTASFSILVWIYRDWSLNSLIGNGGEIVTFGSESGSISGLLFGCACNRKLLGKFYFPSSGKTTEVSYSLPNFLVSTREWYPIALVYNNDTGQARLHVDGKLRDIQYVGTGFVGSDTNIFIGKGFNGRVACLQFYRRPLLEEHIEDAMDKCYVAGPTPAVCQQRNNVTVSPCPSVVPISYNSMIVISVTVSELLSSTLNDSLLTRTRNVTSASRMTSISANTKITSLATISLNTSDVIEQTTISTISLLSKDTVAKSMETRSVSDVDVTITSASYHDSSSISFYRKPTPTSTNAGSIEMSSTANGLVMSEHFGITQELKVSHSTQSPSARSISTSCSRLIPSSKLSHSSTKLLINSSETATQADQSIHSKLPSFSNIGMKSTTTQALGLPFTSSRIFFSQKTNSSIEPSPPVTKSVESSSIEDHPRLINLSQWSEWSSCCDPCGSGIQYRRRPCNKGAIEDCTGNETETRTCKAPSCEATCFNITSTFTEWTWNDSLSVINSSSFISLEKKLREMITVLYPDETVSVTLLSCRKGSVIVHFTVAFYVVDSDQMVRLTENMSSKGGLLASLVLVNITTNKVSNQVPIITEAYLTSASSLRVSWTPVEESINGYYLVYRSINTSQWTR
ncbi:uncharacterized protein LOC111339520 [Stylophora pistillata]|uniref:uncharacterized protein LOC111339520 n=1 Tax=Stylophora pistillata TaxID=50429 RepID=UPI000C05663F|nr:uncharacterized protein LOC111339520 [Stylophora pistillata]